MLKAKDVAWVSNIEKAIAATITEHTRIECGTEEEINERLCALKNALRRAKKTKLLEDRR